MPDIIDVFTPAGPGSLMRSVHLQRAGTYRLSRRWAELYSVLIVGSGSWGRFRVTDGAGKPVLQQPSTFTGSFPIGAGVDGLIVEVAAFQPEEAANLTINYREQDQRIL